MNIAILHYHFNRGGVTQVVLNQLRAIDAVLGGQDRLRVALVHGGRREGIADEQLRGFQSIDVSMHAIPALDYDDGTRVRDEELAAEIRTVLSTAEFATGETLLHVHNHSLGKNVSLPGAIRRLAEGGFRCLLQIHDFAEDFRPANYRRLSDSLAADGGLASLLYPQASQIHYAVLNGRDQRVLQRAQVDKDRLHLLPNSVAEFGELPSKQAARKKLYERFRVEREARFVVYPVRGIRRKNVGEMLLWSAVAADFGKTVFAITLEPLNPVEQKSCRHWMKLAQELQLPCLFNIGGPRGLEFKENLAAADLLLTTSIAEGFGMVFLEAWLAGRNLVGRDLPEITTDFVNAGMSLDQLYEQLHVPIQWVGREDLYESFAAVYQGLLRDYGIDTPSPDELQRRIETLLQREHIDFAALDSAQQTHVIHRVCRDASARKRVLELNPRVAAALDADASEPLIARNAEAVRQTYSLEAAGRRLRRLYDHVAASPVDADFKDLPAADQILSAYLDISRLHPIRFEN